MLHPIRVLSVEILSFGVYDFPSTPAIVADVQAWVNKPGGNFGWMLEERGRIDRPDRSALWRP